MKRFVFVSIALLVAGCAHTKGPMAAAMMTPLNGSHAHGTVHFQELGDGSVDVTVDLMNVPPGQHGFHVHQNPDCSDNGMAAGPHFNPMSMPHGAPTDESHHAGDFGNVTADANGEIHTHFNSTWITVHAGSKSVIAHSIVLHEKPDDLTTQPTGNSGARIACGIINEMTGTMQH